MQIVAGGGAGTQPTETYAPGWVKVPATVRESALLTVLGREAPNGAELSHSRFAAAVWRIEQALREEGFTLGYRFQERGDHGPWDSELFMEFQSLWLAQTAKNKRKRLQFGFTHRPRATDLGDVLEAQKARLRKNRRSVSSEGLLDRSFAAVERALADG